MKPPLAVDSSALVAILAREAEGAEFAAVLARSPVFIGWPTILETRLWIIKHAPALGAWLDAFVARDLTTDLAFDAAQERLAGEAFHRFGKGRHPASLNFGDCMTYAAAQSKGAPLLFKGGDFGKTDVAVHPASVLV